MNKRLILLILALPLILMISLFATANTVSIIIKVPVTSVEIVLEGGHPIVYLNLDDENGGKYTLDYVVYPTNATNKEVDVHFNQIDGYPKAELQYDAETRCITALTTGRVQVEVQTRDGGFKAGFTLQVDSNSFQPLQSISSTISDNHVFVGQTATISTTFTPANVSNKSLTYQVEDQTIASVNNQGVVTGLQPGTTTITVRSAHDNTIFDTVEIVVENQDVLDLVQTRIETAQSSVLVTYSVATVQNFDLYFAITYPNGDDASLVATVEQRENSILCTFVDDTFFGELTLSITVTIDGVPTTKQCTIVRLLPGLTASWQQEGNVGIMEGTTENLYFNLTPSDAIVDVEVTFDQPQDCISVSVLDGQITVEGLHEGVVTITVTITDNQGNVATLTKTIVVFPIF